MSNVSKDEVYMKMAEAMSTLSKANRKKVGAVLVTKNGVILTGCNGTASGSDNICEDSEGNTKPEVLHAELNCILKAAKEGVSVVGGSLYVTLSPCLQCAAMLVQAGIKEVYFHEVYRCTKGIAFLKANGIKIYQYTDR
jgi:dCMP deaminase